MEGGAFGFAEIGKIILDKLLSPGGGIALTVIAITLVLRAFRPRRRGRKPARDSAWLTTRLQGQGFEKWVYVDLVIYLALGVGFGFASYYALAAMAGMLAPTGYVYLFRPDPEWVILPAIFLGIALPGYLWLPIERVIHGRRFRKYVLYMIARQNADTRPFIKWGCTPIAILAVAFAVLVARAHIGLLRDGAEVVLVQQDVLALRPTRYALREATAVHLVLKRRAPNGDVKNRPYLAVTFAGGRVWTSAWLIGGPKGRDLIRLARLVSGQTGLAVVPRDFFGEDDLARK